MGSTRRRFLQTGLAAGAAYTAANFAGTLDSALAVTPPKRPTLDDIEHVVFLMQENRSFDHYYGTLRGVRGFDDKDIIVNPGNKPVWWQPDTDLTQNPAGYVLPFRLDTFTTSGQGVADQSHAWWAQQASYAGGRMDGWVRAHRIANGSGLATGGLCMGHYTREDIPFHYALADAFTLCDGYHCSVLGPTNPNRIMSMSGTVDPEGVMGGPALDDSQNNGQLEWTSYPERLQEAGISWYIYQENDNDTNNMMSFFKSVHEAPAASELQRRANTVIPTPKGWNYGPALVRQLKRDVKAGKLPQVTWILANSTQCEHPSSTPGQGAEFVAWVLDALASNPKTWAKTVVFYTYDENDGMFDHVPPPMPPAGTAGEWVSETVALKNIGQTIGTAGPVGLGYRVPLTVISPFSRGGLLCGDVFDHTSQLQFMERKFGINEPNISQWRRNTVGDLTETLGCYTKAQFAFNKLPDAVTLATMADTEVKDLPAPSIPKVQTYPTQEPGTRPKIGAACELDGFTKLS